MTEDQFHAHRTTLANNFAAAGAELLEFMRAPGTLAAIPNTSPEQYAVAGDLVAIQALLPNRRERRGQRPKDELYFGPEAGQPRRWSILITEGGKGVVADYGYRFPEASAELERVDVIEATPPATTGASTAPNEDQWISRMQYDAEIDEWAIERSNFEAEIEKLKGSVAANTVLTDERKLRDFIVQWSAALYPNPDELMAAIKANIGQSVAAQAGQVAVPSGWIAVARIQGEETSVAFRDLETAKACSVEGEPIPFWISEKDRSHE